MQDSRTQESLLVTGKTVVSCLGKIELQQKLREASSVTNHNSSFNFFPEKIEKIAILSLNMPHERTHGTQEQTIGLNRSILTNEADIVQEALAFQCENLGCQDCLSVVGILKL